MLNKVVFVRQLEHKYKKDESKHTKINNVALKLLLDLRLSSQERSPIRSKQCSAFDVDSDRCSIFDVADVAVEVNVRPVSRDFLVQSLEISNSFVHIIQLALICADRFLVRPLLRPQIDDLCGVDVTENALITDGLPDLVEAPLESTHAANANVVLTSTALIFVLNGGVLAKDVAIADSVNLVARFAVLVFIFVKPKGESTLGILQLHPLGGKGNAKKSSEEPADIVGGIVAADMGQKRSTCQPLQDGLTPFQNSIVDSILCEKRLDLLGDLVGHIGGGRARNHPDPNDDRTESSLLIQRFRRWMGEEASRINRGPSNFLSFDQVLDLGTNGVPDLIERGVEDTMDRLDRNIGKSAFGLGEGSGEEIGTVYEFRVVIVVARNSIIVRRSLVLIGSVWGKKGGITGDTESGERGRHGSVNRGPGGGGEDGGARVLMLAANFVNALESEKGQF